MAHAYQVGVPPPWWWEADDAVIATLLELLADQAEEIRKARRR